jgi:hypothetical protein
MTFELPQTPSFIILVTLLTSFASRKCLVFSPHSFREWWLCSCAVAEPTWPITA